MKEILEVLKLNVILLVAGFAGALVSLERSQKLTIKQGILRAISGTLTANYITPVFMKVLNLDSDIHYAIAFLIGFTGLKAVDFAYDFITRDKNNA